MLATGVARASPPQVTALAEDVAPANSGWSAYPLSDPAIAIEAHLGLGTPVGFFGAMVDASPLSWLAFGAGAGLSGSGAQVAAGGRLRWLVVEPIGLSVGGSWSSGRYTSSDESPVCLLCPDSAEYVWDWAHWGNGNIAFEWRHESGLQGRTYLGYGALLNRDDYTCVAEYQDLCGYEPPGTTVIFLGVAVGYAWRL